MTRGNEGTSQPGGGDRQSEKSKYSEKRERSDTNPSGLTPENKKAPVGQDKHVKPANPPLVSGEASTSASKPLEASLAAAKITERSSNFSGDEDEDELSESGV